MRVEGDALFRSEYSGTAQVRSCICIYIYVRAHCRVCTEWGSCCTRFADCYLIGSVGLTFDVNIMSAVGCGMDLNTVGVIDGVRGESGAEIWAGFKISKEMKLF